ncbi:hypothetical protein MAR_035387, partial [Mya arenaria]
MYIKVNTAPKSWREAEAYCSGSISNLISLDRINDFEVFLPNTDWDWGPNEPDPTQGACGRTVLGTSQIVETPDFQFNGRIDVSLTDCTRPLPFICMKDPVEIVVKKDFASKTVDQLWVNQTNVESPCAAYFPLDNSFAPVGTCYPEFEIGGPYLDQSELLEYCYDSTFHEIVENMVENMKAVIYS